MKNQTIYDDYGHGRVPPQATELEEAVLGAILIDQKNCINAMKMLKPEMFYKEAHQKIYAAIESVDSEIDTLVICEALKKTDELDIVGGSYYVMRLTNNINSGIHSDMHAKIIVEKYIKRQYISYSTEIQKLSYEDSTDVFELQGIVNQLFQEIDKIIASGGSMQHIGTILTEATKELEGRIKNARENKQTGIDTGLQKLNNNLCGWQDTDLIILAARPGMGKTALALQFAYSAAMQGKSVCIYSLEMSRVRLVDRMILKVTGIHPYKYKSGYVSDADCDTYHAKISQLENLPIYIDDNPVVSMDYAQAQSLVMKQQGKCNMIILDYLQLAETAKLKGKSREQEVSEASRKAKIMAKTLNVPVILLSQLSRAVETRGGDKRPNLSDLRDSGAIEQDADVVLFAYRPSYYNIHEDAEGNSTDNYGELIISKNRNGSLETVPFHYNEAMTTIADYANINKVEPF